jgi:hypothetical protein
MSCEISTDKKYADYSSGGISEGLERGMVYETPKTFLNQFLI